ncbi:putative ATP-grasp-modified RiPP [Streptomyces sp. NPDC057697]|uniref:putative ATP-grasp-modified RiPP n=1 Tax=Streptomyces sp. NPDC057697 TaxID=3346219 RepID=UPI0036A78C07
MSLLLERVPSLSHEIAAEPVGPAETRPFGLDSLTDPMPVHGHRPVLTVDPVTQLSLVDGFPAGAHPTMSKTSCNTESDGKDAIAVDTDQNDDEYDD